MFQNGRHAHYGGYSCPSCRAFFRRSVQSKAYKTFICNSGKCTINSKRYLKINSLFSFKLFQAFFFQNDLAYYTKLSAKRFSLMTRLISHSSLLFQLEKLQVVSIPEMSEEWHETGMGFGKETFYETLV